MMRGGRSYGALALIGTVTGMAVLSGCGSSGPGSDGTGDDGGVFSASLDEACAAAADESGELSYVASTDAAVFAEEIAPFTAAYPDIKVKYTNVRSTDATQTLLAEAQARHGLSFDALSGEINGFQPLFEQGMVRDVDWAALGIDDDLALRQDDGTAFRSYRLITGIAYNTELVSADELPDTWEELIDARWAGRIIVDPRGNYISWLAPALGKDATVDWLQRFLDTDQPLIIQGATASAQKVIAGEALVTTSAADANVRESQEAGAPLDIKYLDYVPTSDYHTLIMKDSPRPNSAACFLGWLGGPEGRAQKEKYEFQRNDSRPADVPEGSTLVVAETPEDLQLVADTAEELAKLMAG